MSKEMSMAISKATELRKRLAADSTYQFILSEAKLLGKDRQDMKRVATFVENVASVTVEADGMGVIQVDGNGKAVTEKTAS